jgi:hypothetical protein
MDLNGILLKNLLSDLVANHIGTTVHVLPAFERVHNDTFNSKVDDFNQAKVRKSLMLALVVQQLFH